MGFGLFGLRNLFQEIAAPFSSTNLSISIQSKPLNSRWLEQYSGEITRIPKPELMAFLKGTLTKPRF